jgi:hypothetical protein
MATKGIALPLALAAAVSAARSARGAEPPPPPAAPGPTPYAPPPPPIPLVAAPEIEARARGGFVVRVEGNMAGNFLGPHTTNGSFWALTFGADLSRYLTLEATVGYGPDSTTNPMGTFDTSPGFAVMAGPRLAMLRSDSGRHALTFLPAAFMLTGGFQGTVVFAHLELAYEYRLPGGVTFLLGYGRDIALNTPPEKEVCQTPRFFSTCYETFRAGDDVLHLRFALGFTIPPGGWPAAQPPPPPSDVPDEPLPPAAPIGG